MSKSNRRGAQLAMAQRAGQWWVECITAYLPKANIRKLNPGRNTSPETVARFGEEIVAVVLQKFAGESVGAIEVNGVPSPTIKTLAAKLGLDLQALPQNHGMRFTDAGIEVRTKVFGEWKPL
jgi:hypothetical protein